MPIATFGEIWNDYFHHYPNDHLFYTTNKHFIKPGNSTSIMFWGISQKNANEHPIFFSDLPYWWLKLLKKCVLKKIVGWNKNFGQLYHNTLSEEISYGFLSVNKF